MPDGGPDPRIDELAASLGIENEGRKSKRHHGDILVDILDGAELYHTPDGTPYADIEVNDHRETWPIRSRAFKDWLGRAFYLETGQAPGTNAIETALRNAEGRARFDGSERSVYLRVANIGDQVYLDLCDTDWRAIEIDSAGWRIVGRPAVRFRRAGGMKGLPVPVSGGTIEELRTFLNVDEDGFILTVGWLLAAIGGRGPYPVLVVTGEQGTAKSSYSTCLRGLVDPNTVPLRAPPRDDQHLYIAANNGHVVAFDNVSTLSPALSDSLCRIATGGGYASRELYTNADEVFFEGKRPIIANGIEEFVERPDLADRSIILILDEISNAKRRTERELWDAFDAAAPSILGALLNAVSHRIRNLPTTRLSTHPRMADFAQWVVACEDGLWEPGAFEAAYAENVDVGQVATLDSFPVAAPLQRLVAEQKTGKWTGRCTDLLNALNNSAGDRVVRDRKWPKNPRDLSGQLRRMAPSLRRAGTVRIVFEDRSHGRRGVSLYRLPGAPVPDPPDESEPPF